MSWILALLLLSLVLVPAIPLLANLYADMMYCGLRPGMTRAKVDQHLWAFARRPNITYQGIAPGEFVVRYEFLWFGKAAAIQVIYDANGTVLDPQPIYRD